MSLRSAVISGFIQRKMNMRKVSALAVLAAAIVFASCNANPTSEIPPGNTLEQVDDEKRIEIVEQPESILDLIKSRGEQDQAKPELTVESPREGQVFTSSTVKVKITVGGDLKGLKMGKDDAGKGNHVHVILDNQPYAAHYNWDEGFELRNVTDGEHTLRMFPSRPWHQSYKNEGAFKLVKFSVKNGNADESKPTTDDKGNTLADASEPAPEGADMAESTAGAVDPAKPLLTYSRPKGEYKGKDAEVIMVDFWLSNAALVGDGGEFKVRCTINDGEPLIFENWAPVWIKGWPEGTSVVKLELIDKDGKVVENGGYNATSREIKVSP